MRNSKTAVPPKLRPPAVPLVTHDPYFSVWSVSDNLPDDWTRHWTGAKQELCGMLRVDGTAHRFAGKEPSGAAPMPQRSLNVTPTRTLYEFEAGAVTLTLTFLSPLLPDDLDLLGRPVTYVSCEVRATDGKPHRVEIYLDVTGSWVTNTPAQPVVWARYRLEGLRVLRMGTSAQPVLQKSGDDLRIDWGWLYLAASEAPGGEALGSADVLRAAFVSSGALPPDDDLRMPRPAHDGWPALAMTFNLELTPQQKQASCYFMLAYDDLYSLEYFERRLRPYWRRNGWEAGDLLKAAAGEYASVVRRCVAFDEELMADLNKAGGAKYAALCALSFRQCLAAHKLSCDFDGTPVFFSKENFSNGCINTVDVTYPSAPLFLLLNPELLKAQLTSIFVYAQSPRWKFPFAPHDLGTYPLANGQVYGGGERTEDDQMPVEECGNMLILAAALAQAEGHAEYARQFWKLLSAWARYLKQKGLNPEKQLCTDDFAGHLAGNTNLALKAIVALACYARLAETLGEKAEAKEYSDTARKMAVKWRKMAADNDHFRLAFDVPGSWSQKYNLVWDKLLNLGIFPESVARKEIAFYKKVQAPLGLPLDNRKTYTKFDWVVWSATLAENQQDFEALVNPLFDWLNVSPSRVPLTDWYETGDGRQVGFQARSVVGGTFIKVLEDPAVWRRWVKRSKSLTPRR